MKENKQSEITIIRMSPKIKKTLRQIAEHFEMTDSALIRFLIAEKRNELFKTNSL
jgi:hypothetical protein